MANLDAIARMAELDGVFPVDKPPDVPFQEVVQTVKRKFNIAKVAHGGSLDAAASGVFLVLVGDASRLTQALMCADKTYSAVLRLGVSTDTFDRNGRVTGTRTVEASLVDAAAIERALDADFRGDCFEMKPRFAAIMRNRSTAYEIVPVDGEKPRLVHYYRIDVASFTPPVLSLDIKCAKDASPRALAGALGESLGCGAVLESLRRLSAGRFDASSAVPYEEVLSMNPLDFAARVVRTPEAFRQ